MLKIKIILIYQILNLTKKHTSLKLLQFRKFLYLLIPDYLSNDIYVDQKEDHAPDPEFQKNIHPLPFEEMSSNIPQKHQSKPNNPHDHQLSSILLDVVQLVPRKEEAEVYHVPEEVLSGAHLVEGHEDEGLHEHTEGKVVVEFIP